MTLQELEQRVVLQEQLALDLTLVSSDRLRKDEVRLAWNEARVLEKELRQHGDASRELMGRLGCVMTELLCAEEQIRSFPQEVAAA